MNTPIYDFLKGYKKANRIRLHMPGHKGAGPLGVESFDLTEIPGTDNLYAPDGIIAESERNASEIFGADTFYSVEGSSLSIRGMLYLVCSYSAEKGRRPLIAAARNVHKSFLTAAALLDFDILWLEGEPKGSYLSCPISPATVESALSGSTRRPDAVYLTSPDYLGQCQDVAALAEICHRFQTFLLVDNAHGAYLKFLSPSRHPIDLGADICCDSAHKTLPVLTGGGYLHIAKHMPDYFAANAKTAMALFGSTSPSYLILASLDLANKQLAEAFPRQLAIFLSEVEKAKHALSSAGYRLVGDEPMKITLSAAEYGYTGKEIAACLREEGIVAEFSDRRYLTLMPAPQIGDAGLEKTLEVLCGLPKRPALQDLPPEISLPSVVMSVRESALSYSELLPTADCVGRVAAHTVAGCPPAVPIVVGGERITRAVCDTLLYYGHTTCSVVAERKEG